MNADLTGQAQFRLSGADAVLVQPTGVSTAQVTAATLGVDFDRSQFTATVGLQHASTGATSLNVGGKINEEGVFVGTNANERVAGALTRDGTEAGYLFSKDVAAGTFRGITLWKR
jgi:xanthine dehydrogenase molybdopterin-binding subunit B